MAFRSRFGKSSAVSKPRTFHRIFIANRGEVAARVARTCVRMGIEPVFGVSTADKDAPYTRGFEQIVLGPSRASESYLDPVRVVQAAKQARCSAIHPGWGFLAESPLFAALAETHGIRFIGPKAETMALMGKKTPAKRAMAEAGLRTIPGSEGILRDVEEAKVVAQRVGYPVLLKAESGGGGRGMRIARSASELPRAFEEATAEALAAFGDPRVYLEKLIERGRHVEVQLMADRYGNVVHFGERDCTVQRNHQKLIEESPAPGLDPEERERTFAAALEACRRIGYVGAGTMEFLQDEEGKLRFMEMNTRLQVEHTVSEFRAGVDLVEAQILVAAGHRLPFTQQAIELTGHAIECRINAEDPKRGFMPSPGVLERFEPPLSHEGIRVDTHVEEGYEISPHYDSLICKIIAHGTDREQARARMLAALEAFSIEGVPTTIEMHRAILSSSAFIENAYDTSFIPGFFADGGE